MKKAQTLIIASFILLVLAVAGYWYFLMNGSSPAASNGDGSPSGFQPFGRTPTGQGRPTGSTSSTASSTGSSLPSQPLPALRLLSSTPIGGYGASTTASTTIVRWADRGRGNVYEARGDTLDVLPLSNTLVPRIFRSVWNKNASSFVASLLEADTDVPLTVSAALIKQTPPPAATSTASTTVPAGSLLTAYSLKGKNLMDGVIDFASSPKKDKVFFLVEEAGQGSGYTASFDGAALTKLFATPLTQLNVEWPEDATIALTTKGSASQSGFLYLVDLRTKAWKKAVGPILGLSAKVSRDAKYAFLSAAGGTNSISNSLYDLTKGQGTDVGIRTLADKCVWGNFYKNMLYCAVPSQLPGGTYPDDWYQGSVDFADKIWQINATTGEVHIVSNLLDQADRIIDAYELQLDEKDDFLYFINKRDLTLWSLDLVQAP